MIKVELIERLIANDSDNVDAVRTGSRLFQIYGSYNAVVEARQSDIIAVSGIDDSAAERISMIPNIARYIYSERLELFRDLSNYKLAEEYLKMMYLGQYNEMMYALALNDEGRLIKRELIQEGTVDETNFYMRKIMEYAMLTDACALVISHNHPGGTLDVSMADFQCTVNLSKVASDYGVIILDHIIVADGKAHSMAYMGEMPVQEFKPTEKGKELLRGWIPGDEFDD